jgi:hypothetical protein
VIPGCFGQLLTRQRLVVCEVDQVHHVLSATRSSARFIFLFQ